MNYFFNQNLIIFTQLAWAKCACHHIDYFYGDLDICPTCRNSGKIPIPLSEVLHE